MNELALCAGVGGMALGLAVADGRHRTVGYVERDAHAAALLVARMADAALDRAPVWDDLTTFDGRPYRGRVDLISSGLPCQPYSVAGRGLGHADERALWPHFVRIVEECEPAVVFIENVPPFRKHFEPVWRELRRLGFIWAPPLLQTASESGAPHLRERFYALAAHPERLQRGLESGRIERPDGALAPELGDTRLPCADADGAGLEGWGLRGSGRADERAPRPLGDPPADADSERREGEWCGWVFDSERQTLRHDVDRCGGRCRIRGSFWDSESPILRVDARPPGRMDELRAIGNVGAPPVVYARAFLTLWDALEVALGWHENEKRPPDCSDGRPLTKGT